MWGAGEPRRRAELPVTGARALDALAFRGRRDKAGLARAAAAMRGAVRHHPSNVTAELTRDEIQAVIEAGTTGARDRHVISAALRVVDAMKERPTAPVSKKRSVVSAAKRKGPIAPIAERATPDTSVVPKRTAVRRRCSSCGQRKPLSQFGGKFVRCTACREAGPQIRVVPGGSTRSG